MPAPLTRAYLIASGQFHDIDHPRLELLKLFAEHPSLRVTVAADYADTAAIAASDFLVTYTCNVLPTEDQQKALRDFVASGKRWFALHGTNSILEFQKEGVNAPETAPILMETLGTQFIAHPPIMPFKIETTDPEHALVKGIGDFVSDDELYLSRIHGDIQVLMHTHFDGEATGFIEKTWNDGKPRPVYYINKVGKGEVLYLNLGHSRGHWDMVGIMDYYPKIERGAWDRPQFYELLRRGIKYCFDRAH
ncbi:MAG: ThuA domain-containing protein [Gammaproteobacteria bacterium]|nr:ThuA domain-containing protein [Gammaproteobacteria bacterium]